MTSPSEPFSATRPGYPGMPEPVMRIVNGVRLTVFEAGPPDGPALVLSHGFPELSYSWRHQIAPLAAAGYHVIVPDQRGYGWSECPRSVEAYDMASLTADLAGLLDATGHETGIFAGHDWGGLLVWQMPLRHPDRTAGVIGVNTPFIPRLSADPIDLMRSAYGDGMYIVFFQEPGRAEALLEADLDRSFRFFMRYQDPKESEGLLARGESGGFPEAFSRDESQWPGQLIMGPEDRSIYTAAFERTGFTGAINWYRNFSRNWRQAEGQPEQIHVPALMVTAEHDLSIPPSMAENIANYVPDVEVHMLEACGHWTQHEQPEALNRLMLDWLSRRFPA